MTVEEAAAECRFATAQSMGVYGQYHSIDECPNHGISCDELVENSFIAGAEWQAKQSPWISVEERLPDIIDDSGESEYVLVRYKDCIPIVAKYCTEEYHVCPTFKVSSKKLVSHWWTTDSEWIKHEITHWMPIPPFKDTLKDNKD